MSHSAFARSLAPQRRRRMRPLAPALWPREVAVELPAAARLIEAAHTELAARAIHDAHRCYGYSPALADAVGIDTALPASRRLAAAMPDLAIDGGTFGFNFLRLSMQPQRGRFPFHIDGDAATALTGDLATFVRRLVFRLLVNLSTARPRTLAFLDLDPACVRLAAHGGHVQCAQPVDADRIVRLALPPRRGRLAHGVLFCASRVLHSGEDGEHGNFVAGFGREELVGG